MSRGFGPELDGNKDGKWVTWVKRGNATGGESRYSSCPTKYGRIDTCRTRETDLPDGGRKEGFDGPCVNGKF